MNAINADLYQFSGRLTYETFVTAAEKTLRAILARINPGVKTALSMGTQGGASASVRALDAPYGVTAFRVQLPSIPLDTQITADYARRLLALLIHEACHLAVSDMGRMNRLVNTPQVEGIAGRRAADFMNILEDYYLERAATDPRNPVVANAPHMLGYLNDLMQAPGGALGFLQQTPEAQRDPYREAQWLLTSHINAHGQQVTPELDKYRDATRLNATPETLAIVDDALKALDTMQQRLGPIGGSSRHLSAATERYRILCDMLRKLNKQRQQQGQGQGQGQQQADPDQQADPNQQGQGQGQGQGQKGQQPNQPKPEQGDDDGKGEADDQSGEGDAQGESQPGGNQGTANAQGAKGEGEGGQESAPAPSNGQGGQGAGSASEVQGKPQSMPGKNAAAKALKDAMPSLGHEQVTQAVSTVLGDAGMLDARRTDGLVSNFAVHDLSETMDVIRNVDARAMADAFRRGLQSVEKITQEHRLQSGRMDRRAICRASTGALDVFSRRSVTPGMSTAVVVMLDFSGSMDDDVNIKGKRGAVRVSRAHACLGILAQMLPALDRARTQNAAFGFSGGLGQTADGKLATMFPLKRWQDRQPTEIFAERFGRLRGMGGTPMAQEVNFATREVLTRRADRHVVLWLHDGTPVNEEGVREALRLGRARGVEHYGIGIDINPEDIFGERYSRGVYDLARLPATLEEILLQGARR